MNKYPSKENLARIIFKTHLQKPQKKMPQLNIPNKKKEGVDLQGQVSQVLEPSFITLILGRPGSGKTHLLSQMITRPQFYGNKFDRILYIVGADIPGVIHDEQINTCRQVDPKWIRQRIKETQQWNCQHILLVFDDVISHIPTNQKNQLKTIFYNRRHILKNGNISIMVTSQKYTSVPTWIRTVISQAFIFQVQPSQCRLISQQLNTGKQNRVLAQLFSEVTKHEFLFFNLDKGKAYDRLFKLL